MKEDYFMSNVDKSELIMGLCTTFVSKQEIKFRPMEKYDKKPYENIAKYQRNKQYKPENVRTMNTLKKCTEYLVQTFMPLLLGDKLPKIERQMLAIFVYERIRAIRSEYFVQGIIYPFQILRIIKILMTISTIVQNTFEAFEQKVGLEYLIGPYHRQTMIQKFNKEYLQSLKISLLYIDKHQIYKLIQDHQIILIEESLIKTLKLKVNIQKNNYQIYYRALQSQEPIVQILLWRKFMKMKQIFVEILKKSFGDIQLSWLFKRLGFQQPKQELWLNLKKNPQVIEKGIFTGSSLWIQHQSLMTILK